MACFGQLEAEVGAAGVGVVDACGARWLYRSGEFVRDSRCSLFRPAGRAPLGAVTAPAVLAAGGPSAPGGGGLQVVVAPAPADTPARMPGADVANDDDDDYSTGAALASLFDLAHRGHGSVRVGKRTFHVVRQSDRSVYAISKGRRRSLIATRLPFGVLVATFRRSIRPQLVAPAVEAFCDRLRE